MLAARNDLVHLIWWAITQFTVAIPTVIRCIEPAAGVKGDVIGISESVGKGFNHFAIGTEPQDRSFEGMQFILLTQVITE